MATLKYKTPEGEWKKVSIGGGGSTEEVYVGSDEPTEGNVKVWIDPTGTPSQPSQPSVDNGIRYYVLPEGITAGLNDPERNQMYQFTDEEAAEFKKVANDWGNHIYIVVMRVKGEGLPQNIIASFQEVNYVDGMMQIWVGGSFHLEDMLCTDIVHIEMNEDGSVEAHN